MGLKTVWTAIVQRSGYELIAQAKSSKDELIRRIQFDDPIWTTSTVIYKKERMLKKRKFRRGLAFGTRATP